MRCAGHLAAVLEFCGNGVLTDGLVPSPDGPVRLVDVATPGPGAEGQAEEAAVLADDNSPAQEPVREPVAVRSPGNPGIPRRRLPQRPAARPGQRAVAAVRRPRPGPLRPPPAPGRGGMARLAPARGLSARSSTTIPRRCSARTCPHSPRLCGRRSSTRCLPQPDAARKVPRLARSLHRADHPGLVASSPRRSPRSSAAGQRPQRQPLATGAGARPGLPGPGPGRCAAGRGGR